MADDITETGFDEVRCQERRACRSLVWFFPWVIGTRPRRGAEPNSAGPQPPIGVWPAAGARGAYAFGRPWALNGAITSTGRTSAVGHLARAIT